jgi:uncharacterized protein YndB with AHSA1/START domain
VGQRDGDRFVTVIRHSAEIDASPEEVWRIVGDPRNLPQWNQHILAVHEVPPTGLVPGAKYWTEMGGFGIRFRILAEVVELDPPTYSWIRLTGPVTASVRTWVHPTSDGRTLLEHEVDYHVRGGPIGEVIGRALRLLGATRMLKKGIEAQKRQVEGS